MSRHSDCKVYVGDLGNSASKQDIEDSFKYYGPLRNVWVARNPPGFAFVEFEDPRDAEDAIRGLDGRRICGRKARVEKYGRTICGRRARVEMSSGKNGGRYRGPPPRSRGKPFHPDDRCYECGDRGHYARDCTKYRRGGRHRSRSRSRSRSRDRRSRTRSNSRSRSRSRNRSRSVSRKRSRSRSRTNDKRSRSRSHSRSRSRSRSVKENGNSKD
ncbi:unnamed protein product [Psylliodes chrysocephalus]|uniref:Uncharacterized protein n=1 Tax=Psylliodes chrysocephalus TaxID=3402493 RepID=A0A9P0DAF9_9CUCU|nr:unnamed protein product [Psylliodes chrysocephala]